MRTLYLPSLMTLLLFFGFKGFSQTIPSPDTHGKWSPKIEFDIVPVAVANLPDGRLVTWSSKYHDDFGGDDGFTFTQIFDPNGGLDGFGGVLPRTVTDTNHDMFCPGINNLADGRLLVTGGSSDEKSSIYDPKTEKWEKADDLNIPRGYQGAVTLSDGSAFTIGGSWSGGPYGGRDAEIWTMETKEWKVLSGLPGSILWNANDAALEPEGVYRLDNHAWLWAAPNGKIFHAGPGQEMHWFDVSGNGSFTPAGPNGKRGDDQMSMNGNTVMFDVGKILKVGGSGSYSSKSLSNEKAYVIDINDENDVTVTRTANDMQHARIYVSSVALPNGEVLVMGGMETAVVFSDAGAHLVAEMYDPVTNLFRPLASMQVPRTYHSAGILLKDGRVFMGGGGLCGENCAANHKDAEIYSPPYLYDSNGELATRPTLNAPDKAYYNTPLPVTATPGVTQFSFIRMSSATHSINNEQRRVPVTFTENNGYYNLNMPDANLMPPGYYMLFALDGNGVPSISQTVLVGTLESRVKGDNLLVEFDFFEGSGNLVMDTSGHNNHGTIKQRDDNGNPVSLTREYWTANGLSGSAMEMDGSEHNSNSILEIAPSPELQALTNQITVMAWVNRDKTDAPPNVAIFNHYYTSGSNGSFFIGYHGDQFKFEFFTTTNGHASIYHDEMRSTPEVWEHVVGTYDGSVARLYVNGEEIESTPPVTGNLKINNTGTEYDTFTLSGFYDEREMPVVSGGNSSGITDELNGRMDKFKLYNVALTAQEIKGIYNAEVDIVKVESPCDDIALEYELNGVRDGRRKEISVREGDTVGLFLDDESIHYTVTGPDDVELPSHTIENITQSGVYSVNFSLKKYSLAQDIKAIYASSEQTAREKAPKENAVDRNSKSFWHTQWSGGSTPYPKHPHEIHLDLGVSSIISGLEYLPRQDEPINGTITKYEIYVSNSPTGWDTEPDAEGFWLFDSDLKYANFPEKEGRYVRLVALEAAGGTDRNVASAAEIRVVKTEFIDCVQTLKINVHTPKTYTFNEQDGWSVLGDPSGASGQFDDIIVNSGNAVISKNTMCNSVTVEPGASLSIEDTIGNTSVILTVKSGLNLNSSSMSYASLIDNGWLTGEVRYNRHVNAIGTSAGGGNDLISFPIDEGIFDVKFVADNPRLAKHPTEEGIYAFAPFNVSTGKYENFNIGSDLSGSFPIAPGSGYRAATDTPGSSLMFAGRTTRNPVSIPISETEGKAWNLIGNPYPSYLDFEEFLDKNLGQLNSDSDGIYQAAYGYEGVSNGWTVWNKATIADSNIITSITPGQGFFVKAQPGGGIVQFTPEMRITGDSDDFIQGRQSRNVALSKLKLSDSQKSDVTSIYFIDGTTRAMDRGYDAGTFTGVARDFLIFTNLVEDHSGTDIAIQSLPYEDFNEVTVPLGIKAKAGAELSISIDGLSTIPSTINVYLEDKQENTMVLLNRGPYTFKSTVDLNTAERFNIHYSSKPLSIDDLPSNDNLRIYVADVPKSVMILGQLKSATTASIYDLHGRLVLSKTLNAYSTENAIDVSTISTGVYIVKLGNDHQVKTQKVIIK